MAKELNKILATENAIITQADKVKTILIKYSEAYSEIVQSSLQLTTSEPWPKIPSKILKTDKKLQESNLIIDNRQIKYLTQMKATPPQIKAQIKLHKLGNPIRLVMNNRTAPT